MNGGINNIQAMLDQRKSELVISNISESFGEYALSEEASVIREKINNIVLSGNCSIVEMNDIITDIRESNLSENTQRILVKKIFEAYSVNDVEEMIVEESITLLGTTKFDGDPAKNAEYISLLREMDKFVSHIVDLLDADFDIANDILKLFENHAKKDKTKEDIQKLLSDCLNRFDAGNKKYNKNLYKDYYEKFVKFNRISKSFNNRYSKITMAEKKVIDEKFDKILATLYGDIVKDWFYFQEFGNQTPKSDRFQQAFLKIKEIDRDSAVNLSQRVVNPLYNYIAKCWSNTVQNINYMRRILGIELEDTTKWKIIHKLFK